MTVREFLEQTLDMQKLSDEPFCLVRPSVFCKDGFSISIQANRISYCYPREDNLVDYESVELGFPSELDDLIVDYAEVPGTTDTVYGYVPVSLVDKLLEKHGGIDHWKYH